MEITELQGSTMLRNAPSIINGNFAEVEEELGNKVNTSTYTTKIGEIDESITTLTNGKVDTTTYNEKMTSLDSSVASLSSGKVDKSGGTFTGTIISDVPAISMLMLGNVNVNEVPTNNYYREIIHCVKNGNTNIRFGKITMDMGNNGATSTRLQAYNSANGLDSAEIGIFYPKNGTPYTKAPTPATTDNSTKIATTAFVNKFLTSEAFKVVAYTASATIAGNATYTLDHISLSSITPSGYKPFIALPAISGSNYMYYYTCLIDGEKLVIQIKNTSSSSISTTFHTHIVFKKEVA